MSTAARHPVATPSKPLPKPRPRPKRARDVEKEIRRVADEIAKAEPGTFTKDRPITIDGRVVAVVRPRESGACDVVRLETCQWGNVGWTAEMFGGEIGTAALRWVVEQWEMTRKRSEEMFARWEASEDYLESEEAKEKSAKAAVKAGDKSDTVATANRWIDFFSHLEQEAEARVFEAVQCAGRADNHAIYPMGDGPLRPAVYDLDGRFFIALPSSENVDAPCVLVTSDFHADQMLECD